MNPVSVADGLTLNITEADNALNLELAREVAEYFRLNQNQANEIIELEKHPKTQRLTDLTGRPWNPVECNNGAGRKN